jgi:DNA-binding GntR family transcriptional regulator
MPIPDNSELINRFNMREEVYNLLLGWIMEGVLRPGEKILDKELAEKMGVSRTPVREALRRLEDKHLVESAANRWTRVAEIPIEESEMIYPIIWSLEGLAIAQAFPALTADDILSMANANARLSDALEREDPVAALRADADFHSVYINRAQNPFLTNILADLKIRSRRIEVIYFGGSALALESVTEHQLLMESLEKKDLARVQLMLQANWQSSLKRLKEVIEMQLKAQK